MSPMRAAGWRGPFVSIRLGSVSGDVAGSKVLGDLFHEKFPRSGGFALAFLSGDANAFARLDPRNFAQKGVCLLVRIAREGHAVRAGTRAAGQGVALVFDR